MTFVPAPHAESMVAQYASPRRHSVSWRVTPPPHPATRLPRRLSQSNTADMGESKYAGQVACFAIDIF